MPFRVCLRGKIPMARPVTQGVGQGWLRQWGWWVTVPAQGRTWLPKGTPTRKNLNTASINTTPFFDLH